MKMPYFRRNILLFAVLCGLSAAAADLPESICERDIGSQPACRLAPPHRRAAFFVLTDHPIDRAFADITLRQLKQWKLFDSIEEVKPGAAYTSLETAPTDLILIDGYDENGARVCSVNRIVPGWFPDPDANWPHPLSESRYFVRMKTPEEAQKLFDGNNAFRFFGGFSSYPGQPLPEDALKALSAPATVVPAPLPWGLDSETAPQLLYSAPAPGKSGTAVYFSRVPTARMKPWQEQLSMSLYADDRIDDENFRMRILCFDENACWDTSNGPTEPPAQLVALLELAEGTDARARAADAIAEVGKTDQYLPAILGFISPKTFDSIEWTPEKAQSITPGEVDTLLNSPRLTPEQKERFLNWFRTCGAYWHPHYFSFIYTFLTQKGIRFTPEEISAVFGPELKAPGDKITVQLRPNTQIRCHLLDENGERCTYFAYQESRSLQIGLLYQNGNKTWGSNSLSAPINCSNRYFSTTSEKTDGGMQLTVTRLK